MGFATQEQFYALPLFTQDLHGGNQVLYATIWLHAAKVADIGGIGRQLQFVPRLGLVYRAKVVGIQSVAQYRIVLRLAQAM